jgi:hypothetical protein
MGASSGELKAFAPQFTVKRGRNTGETEEKGLAIIPAA